MAIPGTQQVTATIAPSALTDTYASHDAIYGKGGRREVADNTERDAITVDRRTRGMIVYVQSTGLEWQLDTDLVSWVAYTGGVDTAFLLDRANHTGTQSQATITNLVGDLLAKGDMFQSVYDPGGTGVVLDSSKVGGMLLVDVLDRANHTGTIAQADVTNLVADLGARELIANKGAANGYAPLVGGTIPLIYLPAGTPALYKGLYDASTNTPAILNGVGAAGEFYIASVIGNAYAPVNVTIVNQIVVYNGAVWEVGPVFTGSISSINGFTGPVVTLSLTDVLDGAARYALTSDENNALANSPTAITGLNPVASQADITTLTNAIANLDADDIPETATRFYLTANQNAAIDLCAPTAADRLAKMSDLTALVLAASPGTHFMPENFADGNTLGTGTLRTLTSLGYTNVTAATKWPRVASEAARVGAIDVTQMDIDWICWQEALLAMELDGYQSITTPGGRGYCTYKGLLLPRDQAATVANRRSLGFLFDFNKSTFKNTTGTSFIQFDKFPTDHADANGFRLTYSYTFKNATFYGNNTAVETDCFIRAVAHSESTFENISLYNVGIGIDAQFALQVTFIHIRGVDYGKYLLTARDGLYTGAGVDISQSNSASFKHVHCYNGAGKTPIAAIFVQGNRNITIDTCQFEGGPGSTYNIFYDQAYPAGAYAGTVKHAVTLKNLDFEANGATRANIRINGGAISVHYDGFNAQIPGNPQTCMLEVSGVPYVAPINVKVENSPTYNWGWTFRSVGGSHIWTVNDVLLNDSTNFTAAANWSVDFGGVIPTIFRYTAPQTVPVKSGIPTDMRQIVISGNVVNNNAVANTLQDITGLGFPVNSGARYYFKFIIPYQSAAATTGSRFTINGPAAALLAYTSKYTLTATTMTRNEMLTTYNSPAASNATSTTANNIAIIEGFVAVSAAGTVQARFASEVAGSAITVLGGAICYYQETYI
jgi:hypothetical protein